MRGDVRDPEKVYSRRRSCNGNPCPLASEQKFITRLARLNRLTRTLSNFFVTSPATRCQLFNRLEFARVRSVGSHRNCRRRSRQVLRKRQPLDSLWKNAAQRAKCALARLAVIHDSRVESPRCRAHRKSTKNPILAARRLAPPRHAAVKPLPNPAKRPKAAARASIARISGKKNTRHRCYPQLDGFVGFRRKEKQST